MRRAGVLLAAGGVLSFFALAWGGEQAGSAKLPENRWVLLAREETGARRASSFRYAEGEGYFLLWGFLGHVTEFYGDPEEPYTGNPEYDLVFFDLDVRRWQNHFPLGEEEEWRRKLPPMHQVSSYQGITTGSYRPQLKLRAGVLRPDLNIVFDQLAYDSRRSRMLYFTGGRTLAYDVRKREWQALDPPQSPPPVAGGTLVYDPSRDRAVLFGGGHVAEADSRGRLVGYTGTWIYDCGANRWQRLEGSPEPPPRMSTRMVLDSKRDVLVIFGGDGQSRYLADTRILDLKSLRWRPSSAPGGPPPRAGHFTVYHSDTGWVIVGGGYNRQELSDLWAFDGGADRWFRLRGTVPTGWHVTADLAPDRNLIVLTTATKPAGDTRTCNEIYSVRSTYGLRIDPAGLVEEGFVPQPQEALWKRPLDEVDGGLGRDPAARERQRRFLESLPANQWVRLPEPRRSAPVRTWGSATFDTDRGRIVYWGGGHCGYGGSDYDLFDVEENTWFSRPRVAEYPERAWDKGINPAGVTFSGAPFVRHGRKIYAYEPPSGKIINLKTILLTAGYEPAILDRYEPRPPEFGRGEDFRNSDYTKWVTWSFDPEVEGWEVLCSGIPGMDLTVSTPQGVMAVDYDWRSLDPGNQPQRVMWDGQSVKENAVYRLDSAAARWEKLSGDRGPWPQNLYEMTALVYDSRRDQLILHGGGRQREEIWTFSQKGGWRRMDPRGRAPVCRREAVYIPEADVVFTSGTPAGEEKPAFYAYRVEENSWVELSLEPPEGRREALLGQNRGLVYDPLHRLVLLVLGERGGAGRAVIYALRYDPQAMKTRPAP